jgi:hypothetical protein
VEASQRGRWRGSRLVIIAQDYGIVLQPGKKVEKKNGSKT